MDGSDLKEYIYIPSSLSTSGSNSLVAINSFTYYLIPIVNNVIGSRTSYTISISASNSTDTSSCGFLLGNGQYNNYYFGLSSFDININDGRMYFSAGVSGTRDVKNGLSCSTYNYSLYRAYEIYPLSDGSITSSSTKIIMIQSNSWSANQTNDPNSTAFNKFNTSSLGYVSSKGATTKCFNFIRSNNIERVCSDSPTFIVDNSISNITYVQKKDENSFLYVQGSYSLLNDTSTYNILKARHDNTSSSLLNDGYFFKTNQNYFTNLGRLDLTQTKASTNAIFYRDGKIFFAKDGAILYSPLK